MAWHVSGALAQPSPTRGPSDGRPRVLVFAYACRPASGSEPAAGWGLVRAVAEFADCVVLVGPNSTAAALAWEEEHRDPRISFVPVPEPWWGAFAKQHRLTWFPLYLSWLRRAFRAARQLQSRDRFDLVYHATYSVYWLPTPAARMGTPWIWGPVGGAVTTPLSLWPLLSLRGILGETIDLLAVRGLARLPATRATWLSASARLIQNEATRARLPARLAGTTRVLNHALFTEMPQMPSANREPYVVSIGALASRKGVRLAVLALAKAPEDVRLVVLGDGSERHSLERLARRLGVSQRVEFRGWVSRVEAIQVLSRASAAVFTGLREEGGIALAEAMLCGVPVIVLANGGARTIVSATTDSSRVALIEPGSLDSTAEQFAAAMTKFTRDPSDRRTPTLDQTAARSALREVFEQALGESGVGALRGQEGS
jgi:glycosyltransferase involved in cell wall biosynthesis